MNTLRYSLAVGAAMLVAAASANAQLPRSTSRTYPDAQTLPTGMCRIWIDGVPANRQPAATDCATARRTQPRNSRIIYGSRPTNVYGNRDPRSIPGSPQYDPRFDPRSSQYDPRLDPRNRGNNGRNDDRYDDRYDSKRDKDQAKWERKQQKERDKEWKKSGRGNNGHDDGDNRDDDDDDHRGNRGGRDQQGQHGQQGQNGEYGDRGQNGTYDTRGTIQQGCIDANRDGVCDRAQSSTQTIPRGVPQGTTRRVCVDANRDGKCDDGGPLVRVTTP